MGADAIKRDEAGDIDINIDIDNGITALSKMENYSRIMNKIEYNAKRMNLNKYQRHVTALKIHKSAQQGFIFTTTVKLSL